MLLFKSANFTWHWRRRSLLFIALVNRWPRRTYGVPAVPLESIQKLADFDVDVVQEVGAVDVKLAGLLTSLGGLDIF